MLAIKNKVKALASEIISIALSESLKERISIEIKYDEECTGLSERVISGLSGEATMGIYCADRTQNGMIDKVIIGIDLNQIKNYSDRYEEEKDRLLYNTVNLGYKPTLVNNLIYVILHEVGHTQQNFFASISDKPKILSLMKYDYNDINHIKDKRDLSSHFNVEELYANLFAYKTFRVVYELLEDIIEELEIECKKAKL